MLQELLYIILNICQLLFRIKQALIQKNDQLFSKGMQFF